MAARLKLSRDRILAFRRSVGALDRRARHGPDALRQAAWAGLQDSMPRAAVLSLHARLEPVGPEAWAHPSLAQIWGPHYSVFVVPAEDVAVFTLGTLPDDAKGRRRAYDLADGLEELVGDTPIRYGDAGDQLGLHNANMLRYAAATGRVLIRWEGARQPTIWTVASPAIEPEDARLELARRYLHVYGPTTPDAFGRWSGVGAAAGGAAFERLVGELLPVTTPLGDAWALASDEAVLRSRSGSTAPARLLPSGDAFFLLHGSSRELLVPDAGQRAALWTSRVWPGALLIDGGVAGTWRRANHVLTVSPWRPLSSPERDAVIAEADRLPLVLTRRIVVRWDD